MNKIVSIVSIICLVISSCSNEKADIIIQNVNIINVETGDILYQMDLAIKDQCIAKIAGGRKIPQTDSTRLIDGTDKSFKPTAAYVTLFAARQIPGHATAAWFHGSTTMNESI